MGLFGANRGRRWAGEPGGVRQPLLGAHGMSQDGSGAASGNHSLLELIKSLENPIYCKEKQIAKKTPKGNQ